MFTVQEAYAALAMQQNANSITAQDVANLLQGVKGTTFANITTVTDVSGVAAAHKALSIKKASKMNVLLFNNAEDDLYVQQVKRSAAKLAGVTADAVEFKSASATFERTECYSVVVSAKGNEQLYIVCNSGARAETMYFVGNTLVSKADVEQYLTASGLKAFNDTSGVVHNVTNDIVHTVNVRTINLANVVSIKAMKQELTV